MLPRFVATPAFSNRLAEVWDPGWSYYGTSGKMIWTENG